MALHSFRPIRIGKKSERTDIRNGERVCWLDLDRDASRIDSDVMQQIEVDSQRLQEALDPVDIPSPNLANKQGDERLDQISPNLGEKVVIGFY
jgi:hypothetical protein